MADTATRGLATLGARRLVSHPFLLVGQDVITLCDDYDISLAFTFDTRTFIYRNMYFTCII